MTDRLLLCKIDMGTPGSDLYSSFGERDGSVVLLDDVHVRHYNAKWQRIMRAEKPWTASWKDWLSVSRSASADTAEDLAKAMGFKDGVSFLRKWPKINISR